MKKQFVVPVLREEAALAQLTLRGRPSDFDAAIVD
jgi:hypothetical protein